MASRLPCCPHGEAALSILQSLLLEILETRMVNGDRVSGLLDDAALAHEQLAAECADVTLHEETARLIRRMSAEIGNGGY